MDVDLVRRLIRIGRDRIAIRGVRSAEKSVSPLSWFTSASCQEVARNLQECFSSEHRTHPSHVSPSELEAAHHLVSTKYSTPAWVNRLA